MSKIQELINQGVITRDDVINFITNEYDELMIAQAQEDYDDQQMINEAQKEYDDMDYQEDRDELLESIINRKHDPDPQYVVLSTSHHMKETYVFGSDDKGNITSWSEIAGLAQRWDKTDDYLNTVKVLQALTEVTGHGYTFIKQLCDNSTHKQLLYKRDDL